MRRLVLRLALLAAPFALYAALVFAIDPFDYFGLGDEKLKSAIAGKLDPPLFKLLAYRRSPKRHVLLGDSRMHSLGEGRIADRLGAPVANLAYGGGSLEEAIRTFWVANNWTDLETVTIGINLDTYNDSNAKDRVTAAESTLRNPALYLSSRLVALGVWHEIRQRVTGRAPEIGRPAMTAAAFWRYQLEVTARRAYDGYASPDSYRNELAQLAEECAKRGIRLRFVVFPENIELVRVARGFGLDTAADRMRRDLAAIATTTDFSSRGDWIENRDLFVDPFHFTSPVADEIIAQVWSEHD